MLKERTTADVAIPEEFEVLDTHALAERLGFKRDTVFTYLKRESYHRIPMPDRNLRTGPIWYEKSVKEWEANQQRLLPTGRPQKNHN